ncbi:MCE family protein [Nocardia fluminea]|uniref:MCE family protein n=1 Tax=Nocardia fluminea TaxID=134984 RepID=UPI0038272B91
MRTRLVKGQLLVFAILAVISVVYGTVHYVGIQRLTGIGTYTVTADFSDSAGIYENASVTYRGVDVGRVTAIGLDGATVRVSMQLRNGRDIPAGSTAAIKSMSAIGEQYVDLVPAADTPPYLRAGARIPLSRTSVSIPTGEVLGKTQALLASISTDTLRTTIDETFQAVNGAGPELAALIEASASLLDLAQVDLGPTLALINDAEPLLRTGNDIRGEFLSATHDLASFTTQLSMNDAQLREILEQGPGTAETVSGTLADLSTSLPLLLADLQTVGQVLKVNVSGLRQLLVVYPALATAVNYSVVGAGFQTNGDTMAPQAPLDVKLGNTLNPPPCTEGYQSTERRDPSDTGVAPVAGDSYCKISPDNPKVVRGARNLPCATDPSVRTAEVVNCPGGPPSTWPGMLSRPGGATSATPTPNSSELSPPAAESSLAPPGNFAATPAVAVTPYTEQDKTFRAPDGATYVLGQMTQPAPHGKEYPGWQALLIK